MNNYCCDVKVPSGEIKCDDKLKNKIKKVLFDANTGKVYDENKNYLGMGEMKDRMLIIKQNKL